MYLSISALNGNNREPFLFLLPFGRPSNLPCALAARMLHHPTYRYDFRSDFHF
jgi:hypothetical protein